MDQQLIFPEYQHNCSNFGTMPCFACRLSILDTLWIQQQDNMKLKYSIHYCSSYSMNFFPENILEDKPHDQNSRWSAETIYPLQYLILKLDAPAVVDHITFGKLSKTHLCNLRKLKVYVGMTDACTLEVLETELSNDSTYEKFNMSANVNGKPVPCMYVKLAPLLCWGPSYNLSIWYVELSGNDDPEVVGPYLQWYREYEESEVVKLCLKHFRQHGYLQSFKKLTEETGICLEDPSLTELYKLVINGCYEEVEDYMDRATAEGKFSEYIQRQPYRPRWVPLTDVGGPRPGMRGGHQMCVDSSTETIYLLGGWDGHEDMGDFWMFHVPSSRWTLISKNTSLDGGPCARSCHKMVLDPDRRQLFVLGRYVDTQCRAEGRLLGDFYMYDISSNVWTQISEDTAATGGPQSLFDHQMTFDSLKRTLYVFGGRVLMPPFWRHDDMPVRMMADNQVLSEVKFSGLYSYHVPTNTWTLLCDDYPIPDSSKLRARVGHSMLFHPKYRKLYILGGQRSKELMNDLVTYNVDTGETIVIALQTLGEPTSNAPSAGFTQRATLNSDLDEIYVLSGLSKDKEKRDDYAQYSLWVYSIPNKKWTCILKNEHVGEQYWSKMERLEPCPRFAHQFVYDNVNKVHYLFGGNPGRSSMPKLRLDDFWKLLLIQPSEFQLMRRFKFLIRKHRFEEQAITDRLTALQYLQTAVYDIIDHDDVDQTQEFQLLTSVLFKAADAARSLPDPAESIRDSLYNQLVEYFPSHMVQPKGNLVDVLPLCANSIASNC